MNTSEPEPGRINYLVHLTVCRQWTMEEIRAVEAHLASGLPMTINTELHPVGQADDHTGYLQAIVPAVSAERAEALMRELVRQVASDLHVDSVAVLSTTPPV